MCDDYNTSFKIIWQKSILIQVSKWIKPTNVKVRLELENDNLANIIVE